MQPEPQLEVERIATRQMHAESRKRAAALVRMNAADERRGRFMQRSRRIAEQLLEPRRDIELARRERPVEDAVVRAADRIVVALAARAQRPQQRVFLADQPLRTDHRHHDECDGDQHRGDRQHALDLPRGSRERRCEGALDLRELAIQRARLDEQRGEVAGIAATGADHRVHFLRDVVDARDPRIGLAPQPHAFRHEPHESEAPEQVDHAADVGFVAHGVERQEVDGGVAEADQALGGIRPCRANLFDYTR